MSKQRSLSKEFFVDASETETRRSILDIPGFVNNIKFVCENSIADSLRFLYEQPADTLLRYVDVSILPLTNSQSRVRLHVAYANGDRFQDDETIANALQNFESAVWAAMNGTLLSFTPKELKVRSTKKLLQEITLTIASCGLFFLWKKMA